MQESDFHEVADEFINMANDLSEEWAPNLLSAAFLYAAARYNAFHFIENSGDPASEKNAIEFYTDQYRRMLQENLHELGQSLPHK